MIKLDRIEVNISIGETCCELILDDGYNNKEEIQKIFATQIFAETEEGWYLNLDGEHTVSVFQILSIMVSEFSYEELQEDHEALLGLYDFLGYFIVNYKIPADTIVFHYEEIPLQEDDDDDGDGE